LNATSCGAIAYLFPSLKDYPAETPINAGLKVLGDEFEPYLKIENNKTTITM